MRNTCRKEVPNPLEKEVQAQIRAVLAGYGIESEKVWGNALMAGWPDLFCGTFWIEVKRRGEKLRPSQVEWFETWVPQGVKAYVCDDAMDVPEILADARATFGKGTNYKDFMPKRHPKKALEAALKEFQSNA